MLLKVSEIQALVLFELELGLGVWLAVSVFAIQLSISANCSLVLLLCQDFDHEQVEKLDLLVARLVVGGCSQLGLLSTEMILGPETGRTIQASWIVQVGDFGKDQPLL